MDPNYTAQDVVRCTLCKTAMSSMYCENCHIDLCKNCVEKHFSDESKVHKVVPLKQFLSAPKCPDHPTKQCDLHCEYCDVPICTLCVSTKNHKQHEFVDIMEHCTYKQEVIKRDLQELEKAIYPKYQEAASNIPLQKAYQREHSNKLKRAVSKQGESLHQEIETIIQRKQSDIDAMDTKYLKAIDKQEGTIKRTMTEIKQVIEDLKRLLDASDISLVSKYKSRNNEFRKLPPQLKVTFPTFQPQIISREKLLEQFGSLSTLSIESEKQGYTQQSPGAEYLSPDSAMLDVPRVIKDIATGYKYSYNVSCLSDEEIWTSGDDKIMKLYNMQGKLVKSVQTRSGNEPRGIAVTRSGDLVYTDYHDRSINLVINAEVQKLIKLKKWSPYGMCSSSTGELLVTMKSDDFLNSKVVRYAGSTKKQSIQWDDQGQPLYSDFISFISENRNLDICVADQHADALVVVTGTGKLRFRYKGHPSANEGSLDPRGIATDSHGHILIVERSNYRIHMVDQDGHFLRYIDSCGLKRPMVLCVDSKDNLYVADHDRVKKIQYYK